MDVNIFVMALMVIVSVSCAQAEAPMPAASPTSTPAASAVPSTSTSEQTSSDLSRYAFPKSIDTTQKYLFYLHGRIIEEQGIPAVSPDFGEYKYQDILERLSGYGFVVISEQRAKNTDAAMYARRITDQAATLLDAGVPAENITVVGASKGALIAVYVSHLLANPDMYFVIMGICHPDNVQGFQQQEVFLYGKVLSIYDSADDEFAGSCKEFFLFSESSGGLSRHNEIVLEVGTGHGILYQPLDEWILPIVEWAAKP